MSDETKTTDNAPEVTPTGESQTPPQASGPTNTASGNLSAVETEGGPDVTPHRGDLPNQDNAADGAGAPAATADGAQTADGTVSPKPPAPSGRGGGRDGGRGRGGRDGGGRGRGRGRGRDDEPDDGIESSVIKIYRCSKVVKGGRTFSFAALVVAGDRKGSVGIGYGKANEVPSAVEKATKEARRSMKKIPLKGTTVPHTVIGRSGSSRLKLIPARPGTGVTAGRNVRPMLELAGVTDVLTKAYGSTSPKNLLKATMHAIEQLRSADTIVSQRGVDLPDGAGELEVAVA